MAMDFVRAELSALSLDTHISAINPPTRWERSQIRLYTLSCKTFGIMARNPSAP